MQGMTRIVDLWWSFSHLWHWSGYVLPLFIYLTERQGGELASMRITARDVFLSDDTAQPITNLLVLAYLRNGSCRHLQAAKSILTDYLRCLVEKLCHHDRSMRTRRGIVCLCDLPVLSYPTYETLPLLQRENCVNSSMLNPEIIHAYNRCWPSLSRQYQATAHHIRNMRKESMTSHKHLSTHVIPSVRVIRLTLSQERNHRKHLFPVTPPFS